MKRREFVLGGSIGLIGASLPRGALSQAKPCPPPSLSATGGTQAVSNCGQQSAGTPAWLQNASTFQWVQLSGTALSSAQTGFSNPGGNEAFVASYSGGCLKSVGSELFVIGGGHADYAGNEVYSIRLADSVPKWRLLRAPTQSLTSADQNTAYYHDGRPSSRHTYWALQFINARDRPMLFGAAATWGNGNYNSPTVDAFNLATGDYDPAGTYPSQNGINRVALGIAKDGSENIYVDDYSAGNLYKWTQATNSWSTLGNVGVSDYETAHACDTKRNRILRVIGNNGWSAGCLDLNKSGALTNINFTGGDASNIKSGSLVYDPVVDCFWFFRRGSSDLYQINPSTWAVTVASVSGSVPSNANVDGRHQIYGRFSYCPELKGIVFAHDATTNVFFIRTA